MSSNITKDRARSRRIDKLDRCRNQYQAVKAQIDQIGYIMQGSVVERTRQCGKPNCRCLKGPEFEHGPYYQWTKKVRAKTVTAVLTRAEADLYREMILNERRFRKLMSRMYRISAEAARFLIGDDDE